MQKKQQKQKKQVRISKGITLKYNQDPATHYVPSKSEFKNVNHIIEQVALSIRKNLPVLLMGETGTGKTSLIRYLAWKTNNGFRRVNHNGGTSVDDIVGKILVNQNGTYWVDGVLIEAMKEGYWYLADEINASTADINFIYHSLLDDDGFVVLSENGGEIIRPHENFRFFASLNPSADYHGTKELNKALMSRFVVIKTDFPEPNTEAQILVNRTGVEKEVADNMVKFAAGIRGTQAAGKIEFILSTRDLIMWADMFQTYKKYIVAAEITILNKVPDEDFESVKDTLSMNFKDLDMGKAKTETKEEVKEDIEF